MLAKSGGFSLVRVPPDLGVGGSIGVVFRNGYSPNVFVLL